MSGFQVVIVPTSSCCGYSENDVQHRVSVGWYFDDADEGVDDVMLLFNIYTWEGSSETLL